MVVHLKSEGTKNFEGNLMGNYLLLSLLSCIFIPIVAFLSCLCQTLLFFFYDCIKHEYYLF